MANPRGHGPPPGNHDPVQLGVSMALEAHRRRLVDDRALDAILAYYDNEGARDPFPIEEILVRLGGVAPQAVQELLHGPRPAASDIQGEKFNDRLTLLEPIGEGGMGSVWRAYDRVLKRVVAIKRLKVDHLDGAAINRVLTRFEREAHAMARVRHPACVQIFDAGLKNGEPFLVMEFVAGKSLRGHLELHPRPDPRLVAEWGASMAEALQACHDVGLIHRDVKPGNILLDALGKPHLTDFGVALDDRAQTKITIDKAMVGTLSYMPPEQALGEHADGRADVYSLGATLFEALTGRPPFDSPATLVLLRQVLDAEAPTVHSLRKDCPTDLDTIVNKCIAKSAADRYATAQALALDLRRFLSDEPVLATKISPVHRMGRRLWRHRRLLAVAIAGLAVAAIGLAVNRVRVREQRRAAIESALSAAAVASDLDAAEAEVVALVAGAERDQADRARDALRLLRGRRSVREAEGAVERWLTLALREQACRAEADALRESINPEKAYAASPDKRRLAELEEEQKVTSERVLTTLFEAERLMAQAAAEAPELQQVRELRARLLLERARRLEDEDPEAAERLFAQALDTHPGPAPPLELTQPVLTVTSDVPAACVLSRYQFDASKGHMVPVEVARGTTPARLEGRGCGDYLLELTAIHRVSVRDQVQLTRGQTRELRYDLPSRSALGPLADLVVWIPPGEARWGDHLLVRAQVEGFYCSINECPNEQWRSFMLARNLGAAYEPLNLEGPGRQVPGDFPVTDVTWPEIQEFLQWLQSEIELAGLPFNVVALNPEQFHRVVRGEFNWTFPWGTRFDATFCDSAEVVSREGMTMRRLGRFLGTSDASGFGVRRLSGGAREFIALSSGGPGALGGAITFSETGIVEWLRAFAKPSIGANVPDLSFRWGLAAAKRLRSNPAPSHSTVERIREGIARERLVEAQGAATESLKNAPTDASLWKTRALARRLRGDLWGAAWDYSMALQITPDDAVSLVNRAAVHYHRHAMSLAAGDASRAVELTPELVEAWAIRGVARAALGDTAGALEDLAEARRRDPANPAVLEAERRINARLQEPGQESGAPPARLPDIRRSPDR